MGSTIINLEFLTRIRVAYTVGIGLLVAVVIGAFFFVDNRIQNREEDASLLETVGEQRMWSQHILLLTTRLANPGANEGVSDSRAQLNVALAAMQKNHANVRAAFEQESVRKAFPQTYELFFTGPAPLAEKLQAYWSEAERVAGLQEHDQVVFEMAPHGRLRMMARELLQGYQVAVEQMVSHSRQRVQNLQRVHGLLSLATVLLAVAMVFLIFRPMERRIRAERENLRELNVKLEKLADQRAAELMTSEVRAESVLKVVLDGIITIDEYGIIQSFNPAAERIFGYSAKETIGRNIKMLMPEPFHSEHDGYLQHYAETGEARIIGIGREVVGQRRDGSTFPMDLAVNQIQFAGGKGYVGSVHDITERKQMELMKREFISTVSHELRTPLTSIRGALGLVAGGATGVLPDKAKELIAIANNNCDRLVRLINDILDMEKIESGKMVFDMKRLDLPAMLTETIAANQAYAAQHEASIVVDGELPALDITGDHDRLIQVLTNLLSNASKFTPPGGSVHVSLEQLGDYARLTIRDEGPGISEAFQERLFQKFSQADSSDTRKKGGTGLGLSITKAIVENHNGKISYLTKEGEGTSFFVDLPLRATASACSQKSGPRILIVEDDADIAKLLRMILEQQGYAPDIAGTVAEARELLASHRYAALTLDLLLPDESGVSLLRELRSNPATSALPVIVVSAVADQGRKKLDSTTVSTVLDWMEKPIDEQRLLQAVSHAVKSGPRKGRRVLHVEDDLDIVRVVRAMLEGVADIDHAGSLAAAREQISHGDYSLVILDIGLPDGSGLSLLPLLSDIEPPIPVLVFSAQELGENERVGISAAFVKSRTNEASLVRAIRASLEDVAMGPAKSDSDQQDKQ